MGILDGKASNYPQWEKAWEEHLPGIDEHIIDYYTNSASVPSASELAGRIRSWFERRALNDAALAEFIQVRKDYRYLHGKVRQRVSQLFQAGMVSAGFLQHIAATETGIGTEDILWDPARPAAAAKPAGPHGSVLPTGIRQPRRGADALASFLEKETSMDNLQLIESKYPRLMRAWEDSLTEIDREIEDVYRYTEDTAELAIDECKSRIEYLLECLPLDIQAHFDLAGIRHEGHLLRAKVEERVNILASKGRIRVPRSVANYFSHR